ncbi:hypothetical protein [Emticicia sp. C21]|uniref:hypothetical protein n=1 Tax=Emticicia sp. C21 TaxID=2302915 RepID=UPI000E346A68|nr:hypothetical protein [Emticicia sp. C21]RFS17692.1 hypothetical protein D0T08_00090 [Emticicia sp. C21]
MKKVLSLLLILSVFSSCQQKLTRPLKGNYPTDYTIISEKSSDELWNDIIAYCSESGIKLKIIDRKSGLIVSQWYKLGTYTFENQDGTLRENGANVVLGCETPGKFIADCQPPTIIWTFINFKLNEKNNKISLTVRLSDLKAWYSEWEYLKQVKSTGFLEKQIIDKIFNAHN